MWKAIFSSFYLRKPYDLLLAINKQTFLMTFSVLIAFVLFLPVDISAQEDAESFQKENDSPLEQFLQKSNEAFREYREKIRQAFSKYRNKAATVWGEDKAVVPSKEEWVSYCNKMCERRRVNFKQGFARYELALDPGKKKFSQKVKSALIDSIVESITQGPDQRSIANIAEDPNKIDPGGKPLLSGLFAFESGKTVTENNARKFARKKVRNHLTKWETRGKDGQKRVIASVTIPMIPDHLQKRAKKYEDIVKQQAKRRALSPELVFSIIETESYFNPLARSPAPAFGLMQIVPVTGGQEAYRMVYGENKQPSEDFLYQPKENVTLGTAYFHRLYFTYMEGIKNEMSRLWCALASYNIGPINLYLTFSDKGKSAAIRRINSMDSEDVFNYLVHHLPSRQTQKYIREIRKNIPKYESL
ncbi:MAG: murein transglycosylase domain-containing protein [Desulfohalobiaceae bacterium]